MFVSVFKFARIGCVTNGLSLYVAGVIVLCCACGRQLDLMRVQWQQSSGLSKRRRSDGAERHQQQKQKQQRQHKKDVRKRMGVPFIHPAGSA